MKLDRNIPENEGRDKYALLKLRELANFENSRAIGNAIAVLKSNGLIEWGAAESEDEFFVLKLKDEFSLPALKSYAAEAEDFDFEYASEVRDLARRAGKNSPFCKKPD